MGGLAGYFLIFFARIIDVSMATIRIIMVVRGRKLTAAIIGFVEISIFVMAISKVLSNMDDLFNAMAYALGFSAGNYVGVIIEEKMAIGTLIMQVVTRKDAHDEFSNYLRARGFGVTCTEGFGKEGKIYILNIVLHRKDLKEVENFVSDFDSRAFTTVIDVKNIRGGYFKRTSMKRK